MSSGYTRGLSSRKGWVIWHQERHLDIDTWLSMTWRSLGNTDGNVHICRQEATFDMGKMLRISGARYQEEDSEKKSQEAAECRMSGRDSTTKAEETFLKY